MVVKTEQVTDYKENTKTLLVELALFPSVRISLFKGQL
jgi:hypothetical protein